MGTNRPKPRVVVDTNVFVSALVFGGKPRDVTDLIGKKKVTLVVSEEIMTELRRIVIAKFPAHLIKLEQLEKLLRKYAQWVKLGTASVTISRDADDNKFIETAILGNCTYIVSGDKDLLDIGAYQSVAILTPAQFLNIHVKQQNQ